jgi:hypothetical protein
VNVPVWRVIKVSCGEVKDSYPEKKNSQKKMSERENTKLCQALETILYWQKELHEKRMKFNNSTEGRERESKWRAFNDHMRTLIETNTV